MDVLEYDQATGRPSLVKVKDSNAVYEVTYDPSTDTLYPTYGQKELVYENGVVVEALHSSSNLSDHEKQEIEGIPSSTPTEGIDTGLEGYPSDTVVDSGSTTTPDDSGLVDSGTVSEDTSGQVDDSGVITQVEENWHQGTFPDTTSSIDYHLAKHGKGRSAEEYTNDAMEFFSKHKGEAQEVLLKDGTPGLKVQIKTIVNGKAVRQGGYWTKGGKLVTYWD